MLLEGINGKDSNEICKKSQNINSLIYKVDFL